MLAPADELVIGGITPFTTIDFPGRLAAVLYTQGCAWNCRYCHNSHLQAFEPGKKGGVEAVLDFLRGRAGFLDGVVFCGGEPTAQEGLAEAMHRVRELGFQVALHTAGMYPERLESLLPLCDWVGMDAKAPFDRYERITQRKGSGEAARRSAGILAHSGVDYEIRTTVHPELLTDDDILCLALDLERLGVENYTLQAFQRNGCRDDQLKGAVIPQGLISDSLRHKLTPLFKQFRIRK